MDSSTMKNPKPRRWYEALRNLRRPNLSDRWPNSTVPMMAQIPMRLKQAAATIGRYPKSWK